MVILVIIIESFKILPEEENPNILHPKYYYRGHSNIEYPLKPSITRDGFSIALETRLIELAKNKIPSVFREADKLSLLAKMQHYGLPTRLIDVTVNPLVALYFACQNEETDGEILIFENYVDISGKLISFNSKLIQIEGDTIDNTIIDHLQFFDSTFVKTLILYLIETVPQNGISMEDLQKNLVDHEWFQSWEKKYHTDLFDLHERNQILSNLLRSPLFVETQETLERQRIQQGLFMLIPNKKIVFPQQPVLL